MDSKSFSGSSRPDAIRTFGRRLGRPLKATRRAALDRLGELGVARAVLTEDATLNPTILFPDFTPHQIWFEIGFGQGEHLRARLAQHPTHAFIGAEPFINGVSNLLAHLPPGPCPNLRLYMDDALTIARSLAPNTLDGLYILNPDPWFKKRHHKRRIIRPDNLDLFASILKPGGQMVLSTDVTELADWFVEKLAARADFTQQYQSHTPPPDWPLTTKYMARGLAEGRQSHFFIYTRR